MNAREAIFAAVGGASRPAADIAREAAALLDRVPTLRPDRVTGDPAEAFLARVTGPAIGATATRVASLAEVARRGSRLSRRPWSAGQRRPAAASETQGARLVQPRNASSNRGR